MANPFDEFDTSTNPFDEFDADEGMLTKAYGLASGIGASALGVAGAIPTGLRQLGELAATGNLSEALSRSESTSSVTDVEPSTQMGRQTKETINQTMHDYASEVASKYAADQVELNKQRTSKGTLTPSDLAGENTEQMVGDMLGSLYVPGIPLPRKGARIPVKETAVERVERKQAELDTAKSKEAVPAKNPFDEFDADIARLHDKAIVDKLTEVDKAQSLRENLDAVKQEDAQAGLDTRQAENDLAVKRQATLDFNAAERARQEIAPLPERTPIDPEAAQWHSLLLDEAKLDEPRSNMAAFKEPDSHFPSDFKSSPIRGGRIRGSQRGAVDPAVFKEGFEKLKKLADGTWLRAFADNGALTIEARKDGHIIGQTTFDRKYATGKDGKSEQNAEAFHTGVNSDHRGEGNATEMYKFASELGNDIQRSDIQTDAGRGLWQGFEKNGLAKDGMIPAAKAGALFNESPINNSGPLRGKQRGAILLERKQRRVEKVIGKQKDMIPENPNPKQVIEEALAEGKDNKQFNYTESGATLAAMKRDSAAVLGASRIMQNAAKKADLAIRKNVFPVENTLRKLSRDEINELASLMKKEMINGKRFDAEAINQLRVKEQVAYSHMRAMFDDTLRIQNEARAAKGQEPITGLEAYASSRWEGDFRRPVFETILDKSGNPKINPDGSLQKRTVWYLAANTKRGLEKQWEALKKEYPDLTYDPKEDHTVRYYKRQTDLQSAYSTMLDILGRNDDAVKSLKEAIERQTINEQASFLGQEKHFKEKTGVRGFVGDRPGQSAKSESLAFFQQQIQYAKNAYKWSEIQKSSGDIKELISNPELAQQQPNNVKYIKEYVKNAVGYGEAQAIAHLEDSVRNLGISPTVIGNTIGNVKSFFILQKLGASLGYTIANLVQTTNVLPHLMDQFAKGNRGNPLTAIPVGITAGIAMATGHYANFLRGSGKVSSTPEYFWSKAFKYAEDNGVTARSIYDEAPIESSFSAVGRGANVLGKTMAVPETFVRSIAYSTFVQFLKDSGKFKDDAALFQKAEELVNATMVDYRAQERPMMYAKLGIAGDFLNTLQTYPMNWYNQWNYMGREAAKGNVMPFATMLMLQYAVAGAMGIPGFEDAIKLYDFVKDHMPAETYAKLKDSEFWSDPKLWMVRNFGQASVYGVLSDKTGLGLSSRVASPGAGQMLQSPGGPIVDIAKQGYNIGSAVLNPTNKTKVAQAAMGSLPPGLQGLLETHPSMEGTTFEKRPDGNAYQRPGDLEDHKATYVRTPKEEMMRKFGLRSQREVVTKEAEYRLSHDTKISEEKARSIPNAFYDAVKRGDTAKAKDLYAAHVKLTGSGISDQTLETQIRDNYMTTFERSASAAKSVSALQNVNRMKKLLEQIRKESGE